MRDHEIFFPEINYRFPMVVVQGTGDASYFFGDDMKVGISVNSFYLSKYPVTQKLWAFIMGSNPSFFQGPDRPVECVSFIEIQSGFLEQLKCVVRSKQDMENFRNLRLPSEAEWEYAARGGVHWKDAFQFSGSHDLNAVGWYDQNSGKYTDAEVLSRLKNQQKGTETHDVGLKLPNQLGVYDMSGNVWEWCQDVYQADLNQIPGDGMPYQGVGGGRVLRGGCHHNWAIHCTVSKRYEIAAEAKDECIGFRIACSM